MHDPADIRRDPEAFRRGITRKNGDPALLDAFLREDAERKRVLAEVEALRARQNVASRAIAGRKRAGEDADELLAEMKDVKERERALSDRLAGV